MMIGRKWWLKTPSSRHQEGEFQWEWMCPLVLSKHNTQVKERQTHCGQRHTGELHPKRCGSLQGGDRGEYSGHGDHTKHKGDFCENSWVSWLNLVKQRGLLGFQTQEMLR